MFFFYCECQIWVNGVFVQCTMHGSVYGVNLAIACWSVWCQLTRVQKFGTTRLAFAIEVDIFSNVYRFCIYLLCVVLIDMHCLILQVYICLLLCPELACHITLSLLLCPELACHITLSFLRFNPVLVLIVFVAVQNMLTIIRAVRFRISSAVQKSFLINN